MPVLGDVDPVQVLAVPVAGPRREGDDGILGGLLGLVITPVDVAEVGIDLDVRAVDKVQHIQSRPAVVSDYGHLQSEVCSPLPGLA